MTEFMIISCLVIAIAGGLLVSFKAKSPVARHLLRWGLGIYGVGIGSVIFLEAHCGPSLLKGLGACPAGPWLNTLARSFEVPLLFLVITAVFVVPVIWVTAMAFEINKRQQ